MPVHKVGVAAYELDDAEFEFLPNAVTCSPAEYQELEDVLLGLGSIKRDTRPRHEAADAEDPECAGYTDSGVTLRPDTKPNALVAKVLAHANRGRARKFDGCVVNHYENGEDNVGFHRDDEKEGEEVRSYSFGAGRLFVMREFVSKKRKRDECAPTLQLQLQLKPMRATFMLAHGSCGILRGPAAHTKWEQGVPVMKRVTASSIRITPRICFGGRTS